jgi:hypothetical protein
MAMSSASRRKETGGYRSAAEWPEWTDYVRVGIGPAYQPTDSDRRWLAEHLGQHDTDEPLPDHVLDAMAAECSASDAMERGLRPF